MKKLLITILGLMVWSSTAMALPKSIDMVCGENLFEDGTAISVTIGDGGTSVRHVRVITLKHDITLYPDYSKHVGGRPSDLRKSAPYGFTLTVPAGSYSITDKAVDHQAVIAAIKIDGELIFLSLNKKTYELNSPVTLNAYTPFGYTMKDVAEDTFGTIDIVRKFDMSVGLGKCEVVR